MDKVTRMLVLYQRLMQGEKISKRAFCKEMKINPRTFDRDIEDVRIFLSETFSVQEVLFDAAENVYHLTGAKVQPISKDDVAFVGKILFDAALLNKSEYGYVFGNLRAAQGGTEAFPKISPEAYRETQKKPLLKMFSDLEYAIDRRLVIRPKLYDKDECESQSIAPYSLHYNGKDILLSATAVDGTVSTGGELVYKVCDIESFEIAR